MMPALDSHPPTAPPTNRQQVRRGRKKLLKAAGAFAALSLVLCLVVLWQRDTLRKREALNRLQPYVEPLQEEIDRIGMLPLYYPVQKLKSGPLWEGFTYQPPDAVAHLRHREGKILVGYANRSPRLFLNPLGRATLIYENGRVGLEWMPQDRFERVRHEHEAFVAAELERLRKQPTTLP